MHMATAILRILETGYFYQLHKTGAEKSAPEKIFYPPLLTKSRKNRTCPKADPVFISKYINLLITQIRICRYQQLPEWIQLLQLSYQP